MGDLSPTELAGTFVVMAGRTGVVSVDTERLVKARKNAHLTQVQLGILLGHQGGALVSDWERGRTKPDVHSLHRLAEHLGVEARELLAPGTPITLAQLRILAGYTQAEAAEAIRSKLEHQLGADVRMSREKWAAVERGDRAVRANELDAVAEVLGVNPDEVVRAAGTTPETTPRVLTLGPDQVDKFNALLEATGKSPEELMDDLLNGAERPAPDADPSPDAPAGT